jgi:hypothetical protein
MYYERELKFHNFLHLPAELRLKIYHHYLCTERGAGKSKNCGHGGISDDEDCCVWHWPANLKVCDRALNTGLTMTKYAPWLPALAFVAKQILGEVTIHMIRTTEWFDFVYHSRKSLKIVQWFTAFLSLFPSNKAFDAIRQIYFPSAGSYNKHRVGKVIDEQNPDIQFMLRCTSLETIALTFHWSQLNTALKSFQPKPRDLKDFLDFFHLRPMLKHRNIKQVHLEGIYPGNAKGDRLKCLEEFAKWIIRGFQEKQGRVVDVYLNKCRHISVCRVVGEKVRVEEE